MGCKDHPNAGTTSNISGQGSGRSAKIVTTNTCDECGDVFYRTERDAPEPEPQTDN